jgi:microcystin-dependent protein
MTTLFIGEIRMFGGSFPPAGWSFCDGTEYPISEYDTLFNLIGTTYGGDGQQTFCVPDLRGRVPVHQGTGSDGTTYQIGELGGVESVTLSVNQMPVHTHPFVASNADGNVVTPAGTQSARSLNIKPYTNSSTDGAFGPAAIQATGGSQPHDNSQPYLGINYIIAMFGPYPSQT